MTYNLFSANSKILLFVSQNLKDISAQNFSSTNDDHKEISLSKETDFKTETETLDAWISLNINPNDTKFLSHMYSYMIYKIPNLQIQKTSNKGDKTKNQI
jgi:hypothetical protein